MTQTYVPQQPEPPGQPDLPDAPPQVPVTPPGASEATRLLCAGSYLDSAYRDAVIEELYVHEERIAAPSLGFDAARVLAHALRARRAELGWAAGALAVWLVGAVLAVETVILLLLPCLMLTAADRIRGREPRPPLYRRVPAWWMRWTGRPLLLFMVILMVRIGFGAEESADVRELMDALLPDPVLAMLDTDGQVKPFEAWVAIVVLLLAALCLAGQRGQFARALAGELHPGRFADMASDPAEAAPGQRFQRLRQRIRTEQHAPLVMYHAGHPFCGAGSPYDSWTLAVELRPDADRKHPPEPVSNRMILERVRPLLAGLRVPSPQAGDAVRDRLRQLEIDECVFLPVAGLPRRELAPYDQQVFEAHRADAVEEGGETRRHFLRIRVGGWEEELVTTVFVRVHTQGRMLMLEIAPHVLLPVREDFEEADRIAHQYRNNSVLGKAVWALARTPRSLPLAVATLAQGMALTWRIMTGGYGGAMPDGPAVSVRELGAADACSLFQDMDVRRYLKAVQDRVANGVRQALREAGYHTDEFVQKITHVSGGGVLIEKAQGAFAVGDHNTITNNNAQGARSGLGGDNDGER
ncbi:hypothetical protein [Streptomyces apocyni]|uniref:hypothetical protein n=1 Tax=Streptomyces apocyni TaxID=2654677 RepID=UPI0012EA232C|nr:hypothetical protein [Streptomyces apocyni]